MKSKKSLKVLMKEIFIKWVWNRKQFPFIKTCLWRFSSIKRLFRLLWQLHPSNRSIVVTITKSLLHNCCCFLICTRKHSQHQIRLQRDLMSLINVYYKKNQQHKIKKVKLWVGETKKVGDYEDLLETLMLARQHPALLSIYFSFTILLK